MEIEGRDYSIIYVEKRGNRAAAKHGKRAVSRGACCCNDAAQTTHRGDQIHASVTVDEIRKM